MDQATLETQARAGDGAALAALLHQAWPRVHAYLVRVSFNRALADDLTQAVMERAITRLGSWDGRARFESWLLGIASHLFLDELRRQARARRLEPPEEAGALVGAPPDLAALEALRLLARLPAEVAMAVVLKHAHGQTYEEIGAALGWPAGTVKSRISLALSGLREEVSDE